LWVVPIGELTSREAVERALDEFDELGREAFLKRYGYGHAKTWFVERDGKLYDSKAIAGVAVGFEHPDRGPMRNDEFSGGERSVKGRLEGLGFTVVDRSDNESEEAIGAHVWLFQSNPKYYDLDRALRELPAIEWTVRGHVPSVHAGDRAYIWRAGPQAGVVAVGTVLTEPEESSPDPAEVEFWLQPDRYGFDSVEPRVRVSIDRVVDPPLLRATLRDDAVLSDLMVIRAPRGTVYEVPEPHEARLEELLAGGVVQAQRYFVLLQRSESSYEGDEEGQVYHWTPTSSGAWKKLSESPGARFVYYRPGSRADEQTFFGAGRMKNIEVDGEGDDRHFRAQLTDYQPFGRPVPRAEFDPRPNSQVSITEISRELFDELVRRGAAAPVDYMEPAFDDILASIEQEGLTIEEEVVRRYHLSLKTRGFVVLSGISGTGKTWLAQAYGRAIGAELIIVPVAPNWTTNEDLLGYLNPLDDLYHDTEFSHFLRRAAEEYRQAARIGTTARPYHLVLDEMNLARVEYYFAKFLSAMELRAREDDVTIELAPGDEVLLPPNLKFTGTVNVDETTHGFADKVYDRSQLIELTISREMLLEHLGERPFSTTLADVWTILRDVAPFAFRVLDEIAAYVDAAADLDVDWEVAFDEQLLQKVLPKIRGTDLRLKDALRDFVELSADRFPLSHAKASTMLATFNEHGFTSYF
jgi:MoxR-like ATPase